ncbi:MAG TPA: ADP-ribosylation factor-like protein [Candidatus Deferrimicrobium sp.]|nr:ADP-ribosylation factor-like protein [Candidatus Deferrimicrobium sp.]
MSEMKKILFCGIDNAGKTSILHILRKNYSFLSKLKPTKGIERSQSKILEIDFVLWDLGGQEQYISQYFDRKEFIFTELNLLYFIIDIQDEVRFDNVITYFENIVQALKDLDQKPNIIILYHKIDPDIEHTTNVALYTRDLSKKINKIAVGFSVDFFQTSIFKRWSILAAFSYGIRRLSEQNVKKLSNYLGTWAEQFGATAVLLISADDIIIGEYSKTQDSALKLNQYLDELRHIYVLSKKPVVLKLNGDMLTLNPLHVGKFSLDLIKYTNNPEITEDSFTKPVQMDNQSDFEGLLHNFFQKI